MTKATKAQVNSVVRQLAAKAQSWGQVAKQLSGIKGQIELNKNEKITIAQAFNLLGVHVKNNRYTAQDLALAWSERLKEGHAQHTANTMLTDNYWRCPLIAKNVPYYIQFDGKQYILYRDDKEFVAHKYMQLCRVVKAEDKRKGSTDVCVTAQVVLRGLAQSICVDDTLAKMQESVKNVESLTIGWINLGTASNENWVQVQKTRGTWKRVKDITVKIKVKKNTKKIA
jgi:hypothetical protein